MKITKKHIQVLGVVRTRAKGLEPPIPPSGTNHDLGVSVTHGSRVEIYEECAQEFPEGSVIWAPVGVILNQVSPRTPEVGDTWSCKGTHSRQLVFIAPAIELTDDARPYGVIFTNNKSQEHHFCWMNREHLSQDGYDIAHPEQGQNVYVSVDDLPG